MLKQQTQGKDDPLRALSQGRGGAGNINVRPSAEVSPRASDLQTPTIKTTLYTTGRGGTGNMAANDKSKPSLARAAQDVDAPAHHEREPEGHFHWGRGGEGNLMHVRRGASKERAGEDDEEVNAPITRVMSNTLTRVTSNTITRMTSRTGTEKRRGSMNIVVEKGKALLGLGKDKEKPSERVSEKA